MSLTALSGMKAICEFCRAITLPCSEASVMQMIHECSFPARKIGGIWESDKDLITTWRRKWISGEIQEQKGNEKDKKGKNHKNNA